MQHARIGLVGEKMQDNESMTVNIIDIINVQKYIVFVFSFLKFLQFSMSDIRALWRSGLSARVPECQKLKV